MSTMHSITVSGERYQFTADVVATDGGRSHQLLITAPGIVPFHADSLDTARDTLRSVYAEPAEVTS